MAKKPKQQEEQERHESVIPVIPENAFRAFVKKVHAASNAAQEYAQAVTDLITDAINKKHLNKAAFNLWNRLDKMRPDKRSALLLHFDHMRALSDWDDQLDLFLKKASEEEAEGEDEPSDAPRGRGATVVDFDEERTAH